ncbi:MAG: class I SAM-dependent methyltransferase [Spirochaetales bacterium]|nr:class I SAM-dependent methyltransferase [Spirochaetales bacterium]
MGRLSTIKTFSSRFSNNDYHYIVCNVCGSGSAKTYLQAKEYLYVKCRICGLIYQNPQPVLKDIENRYNGDYFRYEYTNEDNFFNLMLLGLKDVGLNPAKLKRWKPKLFLDIGCATGKLLFYMKELGWQVQGVEICKESAEYGMKKRKVPIFPGTLDQAQFAEESFSLIHFSHLIEHVADPRALLQEVRRILKPDGMAVITTPNSHGFQARLLKTHWRSAIADHLFLFSKKTLSRLLESMQFKIHNIVTWGGLAKGLAPPVIKRPVDYLAKKMGFGDVMLFLVSKQ